MQYLYYDEKTGWTTCDGDIDAGLVTLQEDGVFEIWVDERQGDYRVVIGMFGDTEFTLIEYLNQQPMLIS
jgi:hypothetical protein